MSREGRWQNVDAHKVAVPYPFTEEDVGEWKLNEIIPDNILLADISYDIFSMISDVFPTVPFPP